jgi:hypothetical protein
MKTRFCVLCLVAFVVLLSESVFGQVVVRRRGYNRMTGVYGASVTRGVARNPYTGTVRRGAVVRNPYTGTVRRGAVVHSPYTGTVRRGAVVHNPYTGRTTAARTRYNPLTGRSRTVVRSRR